MFALKGLDMTRSKDFQGLDTIDTELHKQDSYNYNLDEHFISHVCICMNNFSLFTMCCLNMLNLVRSSVNKNCVSVWMKIFAAPHSN